nr:MAG TPA: hypothetical protein [Caudoviricetes sp.]
MFRNGVAWQIFNLPSRKNPQLFYSHKRINVICKR